MMTTPPSNGEKVAIAAVWLFLLFVVLYIIAQALRVVI